MIDSKVISTGSIGNAVLYNENILVDCGVPFIKIKDYLPNIKICLLTHVHHDHYRSSTIKRIRKMYPKIKFVCGVWLRPTLEYDGIEDAIILDYGIMYNFGFCKLSLVQAFHDVPNCGYRIFIGDQKILHITDTFTLEGVIAKDYSILAIEHHHSIDDMEKWIAEKEEKGQFCYEIGARNSHLSFQKAQEFINKNKGEHTEILKLHISSKYEKEKK